MTKAAFLGRPVTSGYRPTAVSYPLWQQGQRPFFTLWDLEAMRRDPQVQFGLRILRAPVQNAKWEVLGPDREVNAFVDAMLLRIWQRSLDKLLLCLEYGRMAGEIVYAEEDGLVVFDHVKDFYPWDAQPLACDGQLAGVEVKGLTGGQGAAWLRPPRSLWVANEPPFGSLYGKSRLAGCWEPWMEKRGKHGAIDVRRLWFVKNAFLGGKIRHPPGDIEDSNGGRVSCQDYARELIEKLETGGVLVLPNAKDDQGNYLWDYEPPAPNGELQGVREYPKDLDEEILMGMGIAPEVAKAAETGSGWSGRSVPFIVFLTGEDQIVNQSIEGADKQSIRHMVRQNFGPNRTRYTIKPVSLVEMAKKEGQQGEGQGGQQSSPDGGDGWSNGTQGGGGGNDGAGGGSGSWVPSPGPRGGNRMVNPATGKYRYGRLSHEDDDSPPEILQALLLAMLDAQAGGDGSEVEALASLAHGDGLEHLLEHLHGDGVSLSTWQPYIGRRGPRKGQQVGWVNENGRVVYGPRKPGDRRETRQANARTAHGHLEAVERGEALDAARLQELAQHLPALTVPQLREWRKRLAVSFGGGRRKEDMVEAIRGFAGGGVEHAGEGNDPRGSGGAGGVPAETGGPVEGSAGGPADPTADQERGSGREPSGKATARRVPVSAEVVNRRLNRFEKLFRDKGQHQAADWMGMLRSHISEVGGEEVLQSLGEELGGGRRAGVQYAGVDTEESPNWATMGHFIEAYLDRQGITALVGQAADADLPVLSSQTNKDAWKNRDESEADFRPEETPYNDKLEEAKDLPGLEASEDVGTIMGRDVTHLTPDVAAKMDEVYGPGKWLIKTYSPDNAFAGFGIYFPQRIAQISQDARNTIWAAGEHLARYGFELHRDESGKVVGLKHRGGDVYEFGTDRYASTIQGDARHWADRAAAAADHEKGAMLPNGGKQFMAQPAFPVVGVSEAERAAGKTIAPGEGRVHVLTTADGKVRAVKHSTWIKGEHLPVVFEDDDTRAMAKAAEEAIGKLPEKARKGQLYAPDIVKTAGGYRVVELNASVEYGGSGYLSDNPFIIDAYVSTLTGREPGHVRFIRNLLTKRGQGDKTPAAASSDDKALDALAKAHAAIDQSNPALGGTVRIPDLFDKLKAQGAVKDIGQFHRLLKQWESEGKVRLRVYDDPHAEPRRGEGIRSDRGLLFYVRMPEPSANLSHGTITRDALRARLRAALREQRWMREAMSDRE